MSNQLYNAGRRQLLSSFDWSGSQFFILAFDIDYTFDENDQIVDNIGLESAESLPLTGKIITPGGYAASNQALFQSPPLTTWKFFVLVEDTGGDAGNRTLVAYYDTGVNIPRQTNGQDEVLIPDWLAQRGWFRP